VNLPAAFYSTPECCVFKLAHVCFHTWWMCISNSFISVVNGKLGFCNDKEVTSQSLSVMFCKKGESDNVLTIVQISRCFAP